MKNVLLSLCALFIIISCQTDKKIAIPMSDITYPETRRDSVYDTYGDVTIHDPYRWLEDDRSEETGDWVKRQNAVTNAYLEQIPFRKDIINRLTELWDYEKVSTPFKEGDMYYYFKNDGLQNQSIMYGTKDLTQDGEVILDPNSFSEDGTSSLGGISFSDDQKLLAYQVSEGGSDWTTIYVKDLSTGNLLEDKVQWVKFSGVSWTKDGFYYSRYPASEEGGELSQTNENHSLYFHKLGTDQASDKLIYSDEDNPQRNVYATTSDEGTYLIMSLVESTSGNALKIAKEGSPNMINVVDGFDHDFTYIDNIDNQLLFLTNDGAPKNQLIAIDFNQPEKANWKVIIPESTDALRSVKMIDGQLFASYLHNASSKIKVFKSDGTFVNDLEMPGIGTIGGISGKKDQEGAFYSFTSFTSPTSVYKLDTKTLKSTLHKAPKINMDLSQYITRQVWFTSKDGTKVPMFVTHKKGLKMDGKRPTLLYGYGGFDIPIVPSFSVKRMPILENDGIYAVANIRGGGEFGSEWHKAGTLERKQNVFDDFQAAAEYLIAEKYTSSDHLAIEGRSNGGLLVGACITQRPDLYAVAFPGVGVLDMLRYHEFTIGWAWATDYGRSDEGAFDYLIEYSPLHNVEEKAYPATMVTTADHDDRVVPAHSFKFIAELQSKQQGDNPTLIRIETSAGHGAGKPTSKQIEEAADELSFMFYNVGMTSIFQPKL